MKGKYFVFFGLCLLLFSCNDSVVDKPKKFIEQDEMVDILYDLTVMDAVRSQSYTLGVANANISPNQYIYKKYNIDSLQFAQNNRYYAANVSKYKRMYNKVSERLATKTEEIAKLMEKNNEKPDAPANTATSPQIK